jgi:acetyl-CoA carboxylase carboxyl transferase alpha subunit/acetyl-CoA carboxylase carboxyl transferase beta subunit
MRQLAVVERDGLREDWLVCAQCRTLLYRKRFDRLLGVCPNCGRHAPLTADERLAQLLDPASARPRLPKPTRCDPLGFADHVPYRERLARARAETGLDDAVRIATGTLAGHPVVVAVMDFRFLGGSLGTAAGEAVTTAAETALAENLPLLLVTASGGARMQEGTLSLMQMAKTSNALAELDEAELLTVTLITDPTYGGVAASFATLSDVIVAEPGARMGFAGPRVIEQTIRERLPTGFQTAEFLLRHGLVDDVRPRAELPNTLGTLLAISRPGALDAGALEDDPVLRDPERLPTRRPADQLLALARHLDRPTMRDHLMYWVSAFLELHGDRAGADCPAIIGGLAIVSGMPMVLIGHQKGHTTKELVERNFGMPSPAGYRKAVRLMRLAAKLRIPLVTLIDTPGAYPGREAEEQGQAHVIAECLRTLGSVPVPVVNVITGEGGSGGALALGVGDRVLMCQNATYSVISPEGCASILWKTPAEAPAAATALRIDAKSLLELGVVDGVIPEPDGGAHRDPATASALIRRAVVCALRELSPRAGHELVRTRRARFREFGAMDVASGTREASR